MTEAEKREGFDPTRHVVLRKQTGGKPAPTVDVVGLGPDDVVRMGGQFYRLADGPRFVLNPTTDPHARAAVQAYALSCSNDYPVLSRDLMAWLESTKEQFSIRQSAVINQMIEGQGRQSFMPEAGE